MEIKYLVISDVHLGHPRNKTHEILKSLDIFFNYFSNYSDLDILFIAGDLFDGLIDNYTAEYQDIVMWIHRLMLFCSRNNIKLRVLEGTPSHDWGQCAIFDTLYKVSDIKLDLKYITEIHIEHMEDYNVDILYVPDEATESPDITYNQVSNLLNDNNIDKVDISIMHGMFGYQIPQIKSMQAHDEQKYLDITRYYIHIGHVHIHSEYDRIIAEGSFDRLAHNEEEDKGAVLATINTSTNYMKYDFIVNRNSKIFKTISITRCKDLDSAIVRLDKEIFKLPLDSYVRIKSPKDSIIYQGFDELKKRYVDYNLSKKSDDEKDTLHVTLDANLDDIEYKSITITSSNIYSLIQNEVVTIADKDKLNSYIKVVNDSL